MHVKCHDQVFNALEPLPYSLFFPVETDIVQGFQIPKRCQSQVETLN